MPSPQPPREPVWGGGQQVIGQAQPAGRRGARGSLKGTYSACGPVSWAGWGGQALFWDLRGRGGRCLQLSPVCPHPLSWEGLGDLGLSPPDPSHPGSVCHLHRGSCWVFFLEDLLFWEDTTGLGAENGRGLGAVTANSPHEAAL